MKSKTYYSPKGKIISSSIVLFIVVCCIYFDEIPGRHGGLNSQDDPFWFWATLTFIIGMCVHQLLNIKTAKTTEESDT